MPHNHCQCDPPKFPEDGHNRCLRCGKPWAALGGKPDRCHECGLVGGSHKMDCSASTDWRYTLPGVVVIEQ